MIKTEISPMQGRIPQMKSLGTGEYGMIIGGMYQTSIYK